jgi:hypothetical protein
MLNPPTYTPAPARQQRPVITGQSVSKTRRWNAKTRARLAALWRLGHIDLVPTAKMASEAFGVSLPYVLAAITDLKVELERNAKFNGNGHGANGHGANGRGANGHGANGRGANGRGTNGRDGHNDGPHEDDVQLLLDDAWLGSGETERAAFARRHLDSIWTALESATT